MTNTSLRATVRRRIHQTDNTNTQFSDSMIDELGNQARRMFAAILPETILTGLVTGYDASLAVAAGVASYPSTFLRPLTTKEVLVDSVHADPINRGEEWRLKYQETSDLVKSGSANKYYQENATGIRVWPTSASAITYPYIKTPGDLSGVDNVELPPDVDDMVIDFVFEKLMGTRRGDKELAVILAKGRGLLTNEVRQTV